MDLKVTLRMIAGRTYLWSTHSNHNMTAVAAFPNLYLALCKYLCQLYIFKQCSVTLFMMFLNLCNQPKFSGQLRKSSSSAVFAKPAYISVHS